jgi:spermidine synthase
VDKEEFPFDTIPEFIDFFENKHWIEFKGYRPLLRVSQSYRFARIVWKRWKTEEQRRIDKEKKKKLVQEMAKQYVEESVNKMHGVPAETRPEWKFK